MNKEDTNTALLPGSTSDSAQPSSAAKRHAELMRDHVDGRWRVVVDLFQSSGDERHQHGDPWVATMLETLYKTQGPDEALSGPQRDMRGALRIFWGDTLLRQLVEARLLAQEDVATVAQRCLLTEGVVEAYSAMFFNTTGFDGQGRYRATEAYFPPPGPQSLPCSLGRLLKRLALDEGAGELERVIGALLRVKGRTLADGLTEEDLFYGNEDGGIRLSVAMTIPELSARHRKAREAYREAFGLRSRGQTMERRTKLLLDVLMAVRIPGALQRELRELRRKLGVGK